jgi:hypothetical protein
MKKEFYVLRVLRLKLIKMLLLRERDISTILISLGITKEEYINRYNNTKHAGYKSESLKNSHRDIERLEDDFAFMLGIKNYNKIMNRNITKI